MAFIITSESLCSGRKVRHARAKTVRLPAGENHEQRLNSGLFVAERREQRFAFKPGPASDKHRRAKTNGPGRLKARQKCLPPPLHDIWRQDLFQTTVRDL